LAPMKDADRIAYETRIAEARKAWGDGPWSNEPDRIEWRHLELPCLMLRSAVTGAWCGYVGVTNGHPLYGESYEDVDLSAHGGLTFAEKCRGAICHVPEPGESDDVFWFGFDCAHGFDDCPMLHRIDMPSHLGRVAAESDRWKYWNVDAVKREVERLAEQIRERG
jgi:hypothetical protein